MEADYAQMGMDFIHTIDNHDFGERKDIMDII